MNFFVQTAVSFGSLLVVRTAETAFSWSRSVHIDQTALVKSRLSESVAEVLNSSGVRIFRTSGRKQSTLAVTRFVFPKTFIAIDYNETALLPNVEDFIIAHELSHVKGNHPLIKFLCECLLAGATISLALQVADRGNWLIGSAELVAIMLLGFSLCVLPLTWLISRLMEFDADAFAAKYLGVENAVGQLRLIERAYPNSITFLQHNLDARMRQLRRRGSS